MIREIEPQPWHCGQMARTMRAEHLRLVVALGARPHRELRTTFDASVIRRAWEIDGKLAAIAGVVGSMASSEGVVWVALTDEATRHPIGVGRRAKAFVQEALRTRDQLSTILLSGDKDAMSFALFLGFITDRVEGGHRVMSIKRRKVA